MNYAWYMIYMDGCWRFERYKCTLKEIQSCLFRFNNLINLCICISFGQIDEKTKFKRDRGLGGNRYPRMDAACSMAEKSECDQFNNWEKNEIKR